MFIILYIYMRVCKDNINYISIYKDINTNILFYINLLSHRKYLFHINLLCISYIWEFKWIFFFFLQSNLIPDLFSFIEVNFTEKLRYYLWRDKIPFYSFCSLGYLLVIALIFVTPTEDGSLPIRARYPFDVKKSPGHEIGFAVEAFSIFFGVTAILAIDTIIVSICNLILLQLEILSMNFQYCSTTSEMGRSIERNDDNIIDEDRSIMIEKKGSRCNRFEILFERYIRHHQRLVSMIDDLNDLFNSSMLIQMFSSTSMICLTGFQAIVVIYEGKQCR